MPGAGPTGRRSASRPAASTGCRGRSWCCHRSSCVPCLSTCLSLLAAPRRLGLFAVRLDLADSEPRVGLAMTGLRAVARLGLGLEDGDLLAPAVGDDLRPH